MLETYNMPTGSWILAACVVFFSTLPRSWSQSGNPLEDRVAQLESQVSWMMQNYSYQLKKKDEGIKDLYSKVKPMVIQVESMGSKINRLEVDVGEVKEKFKGVEKYVADVKNTLAQLVNSNGIWKKNFKVVGDTFAQLQKKVSFKFTRLGGI